jgi:hypothetical protein
MDDQPTHSYFYSPRSNPLEFQEIPFYAGDNRYIKIGHDSKIISKTYNNITHALTIQFEAESEYLRKKMLSNQRELNCCDEPNAIKKHKGEASMATMKEHYEEVHEDDISSLLNKNAITCLGSRKDLIKLSTTNKSVALIPDFKLTSKEVSQDNKVVPLSIRDETNYNNTLSDNNIATKFKSVIADHWIASFYRKKFSTWYMTEEDNGGIHCLWDGINFYTRTARFTPPTQFSRNMPEASLDGKLFIGPLKRRPGSKINALKAGNMANEWQHAKFIVYDFPELEGPFSSRLDFMRSYSFRSVQIETANYVCCGDKTMFEDTIRSKPKCRSFIIKAPDWKYQSQKTPLYCKYGNKMKKKMVKESTSLHLP